jgi:hypothetical protein
MKLNVNSYVNLLKVLNSNINWITYQIEYLFFKYNLYHVWKLELKYFLPTQKYQGWVQMIIKVI